MIMASTLTNTSLALANKIDYAQARFCTKISKLEEDEDSDLVEMIDIYYDQDGNRREDPFGDNKLTDGDDKSNEDVNEKEQVSNKKNEQRKLPFYEHENDQKQCARILNDIKNTLIHNYNFTTTDLMVEIAQYSTGKFVLCCECGETVSFLTVEMRCKQSVECHQCTSNIWIHYCNYHSDYCTAKDNIGPKCWECNKKICKKCCVECESCYRTMCIQCKQQGVECYCQIKHV